MAITHQVRTLNNVYIAEIRNVQKLVDSSIRREFTRALYQSPIVSLKLVYVAPGLVNQLLKQVPNTLETLHVDNPSNTDPNTTYHFLPIPNLTHLILHNCTADLSSADFPKLRRFRLDCSIGWKRIDTTTLCTALNGNRMGPLRDLEILFTSLRGSGQVLSEILTSENLRNVDLDGVNFSFEDGRALLRSLTEGKFHHLQSISLLSNKEVAPLASDFEREGERQDIEILIDPEDSEEIGCMGRLKECISRCFQCCNRQ